MAKFVIRETQVCLVTWSYVMEADNADDARSRYMEEQPVSYSQPEIGDAIDGYEQVLDITPYGA